MKHKKSTALKICGITQVRQAREIASIGVEAIGVIGVKQSPRYVSEEDRQKLFSEIRKYSPQTERVLVVANIDETELDYVLKSQNAPSIVQLHGEESPAKCKNFRERYPTIIWWKAIRVRTKTDLIIANSYKKSVDALLLDTWSESQLGGTGKRIPIELLKEIELDVPWWVAGGISEECISEMLKEINPFGIDASSKLEVSPGIKDIEKVRSLYSKINSQ